MTHFASHHLCCGPQRFIRNVGVTLGRQWIRVAQKTPNDSKTHTAGNKLRRMCVPIVMDAIVLNISISD